MPIRKTFSEDRDPSASIRFSDSTIANPITGLGRDAGDRLFQDREMVVKRFEFARQGSPVASKANVGGAPTGTAGDRNILLWPGFQIEYVIKGTQTIVAPVMTAVGLDIGMDQTDNDGVELRPNITTPNDKIFTIGTSLAFYARLKMKVEDVSGTDDLNFGFRKQEADQANMDDYNDSAVFNINAGDILIETIKTNAATVSTDTTLNWADGETHTLQVSVDSAGAVTYLVDGVVPPTLPTLAYSFTSALAVEPLVFMLNSSDVVGKVELIELEVGYLV